MEVKHSLLKLTTIATKQQKQASENKRNKNNKRNNKRGKRRGRPSQLNITVQSVPVAKSAKVSNPRNRNRSLGNGNLIHQGESGIAISMANNTTATTTSLDLICANATSFPSLSAIAKTYDKIKWRRLRMKWVPSLPTTSGGSVAIYFDNDRTDVGATSVPLALQNKKAKSCAIWDSLSSTVSSVQLRSRELFSTFIGSGSTTENTFTSPGRIHVHTTSLPGVTFTASTVVGYLWLEYDVELMFPTAPTDGTVPTRRVKETRVSRPFIQYTEDDVERYRHFAAGCSRLIDFFSFTELFRNDGSLNMQLASEYDPDDISLTLSKGEPSSPEPVFKIDSSLHNSRIDSLPDWGKEFVQKTEDTQDELSAVRETLLDLLEKLGLGSVDV